MKKHLILFLVCTSSLMFCIPSITTIHAEENDMSSYHSNEVSFELFKDGTQSITYVDYEGNETHISVEYEKSLARVTNGAHKISVMGSNISMSYYINVNSNKITSAYNSSYSTSILHVNSTNLSRKSTTKAQYDVNVTLISTWTYSLVSTISNNTINVSWNG